MLKQKVMICQPIVGKTEKEVLAMREKATKILNDMGYEVVNTFFTEEWSNKEKLIERGIIQIPVYFMSKGLEKMSQCHAVYFCKGWEKARGCKIEHEIASAYGLTIIYEDRFFEEVDVIE